jgi:hypothetical protein
VSTKVASLYAELSAKDNLTPALNTAKGGLSNFAGGLKSGILGLVGITSAMGVATAAVKLFMDSVNAAAASETAIVRLEGTFKSMGREGAAGIKASATELMKLSTFDDEAIMAAYTAIAKFGNISTGNMEQLVKTAMDVTAVMGGDLASNAENIGRILETGLVPRTWAFDAALKEQVKQQVEAEDTAGALNTVLAELNKRYGGQEAAAMETYAGKVDRLKVSWGELLETVGNSQLGNGKSIISTMTGLVQGMTATVSGGYQVIKLLESGDLAAAKIVAAQALISSGLATNQTNTLTQHTQYPSSYSLAKPGIGMFEGSAARDYTETMQKMASANSVAQKNLDSYFEDYHKQKIDAAIAEGKSAEEVAKAIQDEADAMKYLHDETVKAHNAAMDMQTGFETAFTTAKTSSDKTAASFDVIGQMMQGMGDQGKDIWNEFLMQTGKISPAALEQFATIEVAMNNLRANLASGMTIKMAVQMAVGELQSAGVIPVAPAKNSPWKNLGQKSGTDTTPAWYNSTSEDWYFGNKPPGYASGGAFVVPSGYSNDNYLARFSSGERVTVTPPGQKTVGGNVVININGWQGDYRSLAREITYRQEVERLMQ